MKGPLKQRLSIIPARAGLKEKVLDQLRETRTERFLGWLNTRPALAAVLAILLVVAFPYLFWQGEVQEKLFTDAIAQYQKMAHGTADFPGEWSVPTPTARLLDLSPWGYRVLARRTQEAKGTRGRVFVYQGQESDYLLAQEFEGIDILPPPGARVIRTSSREFVSYSQEGVNLIAFKEKDLLCILASDVPKEKLLRLAQEIALSS